MGTSKHDELVDACLAGDLLVGADAIRDYLVFLGMPEDTDIYYLRRARRWPIGSTADGGGGKLVASKYRLTQHIKKITRGPTADQHELHE